MAKVKGTVTGCGKGKFSHFVTIDTREGFYFNTKFEPKCGKGDVVGIEFEQKAENRGNIKRLEVLEKNSNGYEDTSKSNDSYSGGGKSGGGGDRQDSIVWQHSQEMAVNYVIGLASIDAIKLPKAPEARRTVLDATVDEQTVRFFNDAINPRASKAFAEQVSIEDDLSEEDAPEDSGEDGWDDDSWS